MEILKWLTGAPEKNITPREFIEKNKMEHPYEHPQGAPPEYGEYLYSKLKANLPQSISDLFSMDKAVVGQLGIPTPDAYTKRIGDNGYAIIIHSGLPRFIYEVSRIIFANSNIWHNGGIIQKATASKEESIEIISSIYFEFMKKGKVGIKDDYQISREQVNWASDNATRAEMFVLAHEIGHISIWQQNGTNKPVSLQDELDADKNGLYFRPYKSAKHKRIFIQKANGICGC